MTEDGRKHSMRVRGTRQWEMRDDEMLSRLGHDENLNQGRVSSATINEIVCGFFFSSRATTCNRFSFSNT